MAAEGRPIMLWRQQVTGKEKERENRVLGTLSLEVWMEKERWGEGCSKTASPQGLTLPVAQGGEREGGASCTRASDKC